MEPSRAATKTLPKAAAPVNVVASGCHPGLDELNL
jgi:hypothetical protein